MTDSTCKKFSESEELNFRVGNEMTTIFPQFNICYHFLPPV